MHRQGVSIRNQVFFYFCWHGKSFIVSFIKDFYVDRKMVHSVKLLTAQCECCMIGLVSIYIFGNQKTDGIDMRWKLTFESELRARPINA